jgi:hypothetical protein
MMKRITIGLLALLATVFPAWAAATVWPASTNANQTFFGSNNFRGPLLQNGVPVLTNVPANALTNLDGGQIQAGSIKSNSVHAETWLLATQQVSVVAGTNMVVAHTGLVYTVHSTATGGSGGLTNGASGTNNTFYGATLASANGSGLTNVPSAAIVTPPWMTNVVGWTNVAAFGAVADKRRVVDVNTTAGSPQITSATAAWAAADIGKKFLIYTNYSRGYIYTNASNALQVNTNNWAYLWTGISNVLNSTTAILSNAVPANMTTAIAIWGSDNTPAFQAAINSSTALGHINLVPSGKFFFGGPLTNTTEQNAVLVFPNSNGKNNPIVFVGCGNGDMALGAGSEQADSGTELFFATPGSGFVPAAFGNSASTTTRSQVNNSIVLRDLTVRLPMNPTLGAVNCYYGGGLDVDRCTFTVDWPDTWANSYWYVMPANLTRCITLPEGPAIGSLYQRINNCDIHGFGYGLIPSDHTVMNDTWICDCLTGLYNAGNVSGRGNSFFVNETAIYMASGSIALEASLITQHRYLLANVFRGKLAGRVEHSDDWTNAPGTKIEGELDLIIQQPTHTHWVNIPTVVSTNFVGNAAGFTNIPGAQIVAGTVNSNALDAASWLAATQQVVTAGMVTNGQALVTFNGITNKGTEEVLPRLTFQVGTAAEANITVGTAQMEFNGPSAAGYSFPDGPIVGTLSGNASTATSATSVNGDGTLNWTNVASTTGLTYTNGLLIVWSNGVQMIRFNSANGNIVGLGNLTISNANGAALNGLLNFTNATGGLYATGLVQQFEAGIVKTLIITNGQVLVGGTNFNKNTGPVFTVFSAATARYNWVDSNGNFYNSGGEIGANGGNVSAAYVVRCGADSYFHHSGRNRWYDPADGTLLFTDSTANNTLLAVTNYALTVQRGYIFPQLPWIPTNSIPASSTGWTNWVLCNFSNSVAGTVGGPCYVATNHSAAGSFVILKPTLTQTTWP